MKKFLFLSVLVAVTVFTVCDGKNGGTDDPTDDNNGGQYDYEVPFAETAPLIDGKGSDAAWEKAEWKPIDQVWLGNKPAAADFTGRYKMLWTAERLYYLVEITDDVKSVPRISDPYDDIYRDDCLELFIDEDASGGSHENNNNAFAYHMSFDGVNVMDYVQGGNGTGFNKNYIKRNHHMTYKITQNHPNYVWEAGMKVYPASTPINDRPETNPPSPYVTLTEGKVIGFAVAYCDADSTGDREHFMGSVFISGTDKNVAYKDASVFAKLHLVKQ